MRTVATILLFLQISNSMKLPTTTVHSLLQPLGERSVFRGSLLGVSAEVVLCKETSFAFITLAGLPVGGAVSGKAHFGSDDESDIVISEPLKGVLSRRFVTILHAHHDESEDCVYVAARLPMVGKRVIVLKRQVNLC